MFGPPSSALVRSTASRQNAGAMRFSAEPPATPPWGQRFVSRRVGLGQGDMAAMTDSSIRQPRVPAATAANNTTGRSLSSRGVIWRSGTGRWPFSIADRYTPHALHPDTPTPDTPQDDIDLLVRFLRDELLPQHATVLDVGRGTGAVALVAARRGARWIDISDRWTPMVRHPSKKPTGSLAHGSRPWPDIWALTCGSGNSAPDPTAAPSRRRSQSVGRRYVGTRP